MCGEEYTMSSPEPEWLKETLERLGPLMVERPEHEGPWLFTTTPRERPVIFSDAQRRMMEDACDSPSGTSYFSWAP